MSAQQTQDFERLSAYVDNQLSTAEKAELEARLAREPELQANLNDLRRTVRALRALPDVKPPRSFTLTPEQAGLRARRGPLFATFRLAAALCTLLLVVAVARDFATSGALANSISNTTAQGGAATALFAPQAAPLFSPTPETSDQSNYVGLAPATGAAEEAAPTGTPASSSGVTPFARMSVAVPSGTPTASGQRPVGTPRSTVENAAPGETPGGPAVANAAPSDTPAAAAVSAGALQPATAEAPAASSAPVQSAPGLSGLRLAEIALAVLALALAAATWLTRRG